MKNKLNSLFKRSETKKVVKPRPNESMTPQQDFFVANSDMSLAKKQVDQMKNMQNQDQQQQNSNKDFGFVSTKHKSTIVDSEFEAEVISKLDKEQELEALRMADKRTQIEFYRNNAISGGDSLNPSEISKYHQRSTQKKPVGRTDLDNSGSFRDDIVTEKDINQQDAFMMINADENHMDEIFDMAFGGDEDGYDETIVDRGMRRSNAIHEFMPLNDPTVKQKQEEKRGISFGQFQNQIKSTNDDMNFENDQLGEIVEDDEEDAVLNMANNLNAQAQKQSFKLRKKHIDDLQEEHKDKIAELPQSSQQVHKQRFRSANEVDLTEEQKKWQDDFIRNVNMQRIVKEDEDVSFKPGGRERQQSIVQIRREALRASRVNNVDKILKNQQNFDNPDITELRNRAQTFVDQMLGDDRAPIMPQRPRVSESPEIIEQKRKHDEKVYRISENYKTQLLPFLSQDNQKIEDDESEELSQEDFFDVLTKVNSGKPEADNFASDFYKHMNKMDDDMELSDGSDSEDDKEIQAERKRMDTKPQAVSQNLVQLQKKENQQKLSIKRHNTLTKQLTSKQFESMESVDMIKFIDWNERRHQFDAQQYVKENAQWARKQMQEVQESRDLQQQHRLTQEQRLKSISEVLASMRLRRAGPKGEDVPLGVPTAIAQNDDLLFIGTKFGQVVMYGKETQEYYGVFQDKAKEYQNNAVTCIEVHPARPDSVVVGYKDGQIVLFDALRYQKGALTQMMIHKPSSVVNLQFLDWDVKKNERREKRLQEMRMQSKSHVIKRFDHDPSKITDSWMIVSVDAKGLIYISTITRKAIAFGYGQIITNKYTLQVDQSPYESKFFALSARFASVVHPQPNLNDFETILAVGSTKRVLIFSIEDKKAVLLKEILCPKYYPDMMSQPEQLTNTFPTMAWGFAHTPILKDQLWANLAVGWGPLIQTIALLDISDNTNQFYDDGFVILREDQSESYARSSSISINVRQSQMNPYEQKTQFQTMLKAREQKDSQQDSVQSTFENPELNIEKIFFLSDSLILVMTRRLELKLFYTQKMKFGPYSAEYSKELVEPPNQDIEDVDQFGKMIQMANSIFDTQAGPRSSFKASPEEIRKTEIPSQIDGHICIYKVQESQIGQTFNQMLKVWNGNLLALDQKNIYQFSHLRWDEGLQNFRDSLEDEKDAWLLVFARAIDIYIGKVKGFKGVPEEMDKRQKYLKSELKLLITNLMREQMDKWVVERVRNAGGSVTESSISTSTRTASIVESDDDFNPYEDNPYEQQVQKVEKKQEAANNDQDIKKQLKQLKHEKLDPQLIENYKLLIRSIIEFCVAIQDYNFLFEDVFEPFKEQYIEEIFLDELKPFIIAGRISQWELTTDLLKNHVLNYYKDEQHPEVIERILVNLNLSDCPSQLKDELIQFCHIHQLYTGMIYLYMTSIDNNEDPKVKVMFQHLYSLYTNAQQISLQQVSAIQDKGPDDKMRIVAEKSQFYLGYKILWTVRLLLNGRRFPVGQIAEHKWKHYVVELMDQISQEDKMNKLLGIDCAAFFQIVSTVFYPSKQFDFIKDSNRLSHEEILSRFDKVCQQNGEVSQEIKMQYLFFVANVCAKNHIKKEPAYYFQILTQLLDKQGDFVKFNEMCLKRSVMGRRQRASNLSGVAPAEQSLIDLMNLCDPMTDEQIEQLLELTNNSPEFNHLRVQLLNRKEEFVQCLMLFIQSGKESKKSVAAVKKVFDFINEKLSNFEKARAGDKALKSADLNQIKKQEKEFKDQIFDYFGALVQIDANRSYLMIDQWFTGEQNKFINSLANTDEKSQFIYLDNMFSQYSAQITDLIQKNLMSALDSVIDKQKADEYMDLQTTHFKLLCQDKRDGLLDRVKQIKNGTIKIKAPEEYLSICEQHQQIEACAMMAHHMRSYYISVTYYMKILTDEFDYVKLLKQLELIEKVPEFRPYIEKGEKQIRKVIMRANNFHKAKQLAKNVLGGEGISEEDMNLSAMYRFDHIISKVIKITEKLSIETAQNAKDGQNFEEIETICFCAIEVLFKLKNTHSQAIDLLKNPKNKKKIELLQSKFEEFMKTRLHFVIERALNDIEMNKFLDHLVKQDNEILFTELSDMIKALYSEVSSEQLILKWANRSGYKQIDYLQHGMINAKDAGIAMTNFQCMKCSQYINIQLRDAQKRKELLSNIKVRRGTMINPVSKGVNQYAFQKKQQDSSDDDEDFDLRDIAGNSIKQIWLYECGHAFHQDCIERHVKQEQKEKNVNSRAAPAPTQLKDQKCPWCFSLKKTIDFDAIKQKKVNNTKKKPGKRSFSRQSSEQDDEEDMSFSQRKDSTDKRDRRVITGSVVRRQLLSSQEQKLAAFDQTVQQQSLTSSDFY